MACSRGKAAPDKNTQLRLFADSGGFCQKPDCLKALFIELGAQNLHIGEMAHIVAAADDGPRARPRLSKEERGAYANLILLCPTCHTIVDKAPLQYPDRDLIGWKQQHRERIARLFGAVEYADRPSVRRAVSPILDENAFVFRTWGPDQDYRYNPESELADVWKRKVLSVILPNNRKLLNILDNNRRHLNAMERQILEAFRQHVDDLERRHLGAERVGVGSRFPEGMNGLLGD